MADNVQITEGSGTAVHADEFTHSVLGLGKTQFVKIIDGTADGETPAAVSALGLAVDISNDYSREVGKVKIVNDAGTVVDPTTQVAHDAVDSGNPTKTGVKARDGVADVTLVSENDRSDQYGTLDGKLLNFPYCGPADIVDGEGTATASTANVAVLAAAGAGIRNYVTTITATNTSGTDTEVAIKDGTTTKMTLSVPANGGVIVNLPVPMRGTANTAFNFAALDSVSSVLCAMIGFTSRA